MNKEKNITVTVKAGSKLADYIKSNKEDVVIHDDLTSLESEGFVSRGWFEVNGICRLMTEPHLCTYDGQKSDDLEDKKTYLSAYVIGVTDIYYKQKTGEKVEKSAKIEIRCMTQTAKRSLITAKKGDRLAIHGRLGSYTINNQTFNYIELTGAVINHSNEIRQSFRKLSDKAKRNINSKVFQVLKANGLTDDQISKIMQGLSNQNSVNADTDTNQKSESEGVNEYEQSLDNSAYNGYPEPEQDSENYSNFDESQIGNDQLRLALGKQ